MAKNNSAFHKRENKVKGGSKKSFRRLSTWNIENRIMYGIMYSKDIKVSDLAERVGVTSRTVQRWLFEGSVPNEENQIKCVEILGYPKEILFYDILYKESGNNG